MAAQGLSRKRPAPGTSPASFQQQLQSAANSYNAAPIPQLSDEQFLQLGYNAQQPSSFGDTSTYNNSADNFSANSAQASNQLARRTINQLANRGRSYNDSNGLQWVDSASGGGQQLDSAWNDDIEALEKKAQQAKKIAQEKRKQIPPFVQKLSSFLDDGKNTDLIRWADDGNSFIVLDEDEFAKTLIPELFKHNNYASFVRQLNMYGFHKKVGLSDNSMRASERKNKSPSEYSNPFFRRGHPDLLWLIQKPKNLNGQSAKGKSKNKADSEQNDDDIEEYVEEMPAAQEGRPKFRGQLAIGQGEAALTQEQLASVQRELATIRQQQQQISRMMASLKHEHQQLYGQAANFQDQHTRHENSINAILTFLATVYNRSLQGHEGAPGITNLFAGSIPHDTSQGNVVDVGDYSFEHLNGGDGAMPKPFKKQPLLLQAPPADNQPGRSSTVSPASTNSPYPGRQTRRMSQALQNGCNGQSGNIQEIFGSNASTPMPQGQTLASSDRNPQSDIMSVIQNTNARNSLPGTPAADFSNVLNSLENSGGNAPLTSSQRADMLRLINNSSNQPGDNALVSPNPPSALNNYDRRLASTKADIEHLAKMQAEQDRSVQNLTNLLQPLSPSGSIPGIGGGTSVPPPPLDIDDLLNGGDYFNNEFPAETGDYDFANNGNGFNFSNLPEVDDDPLFGDVRANDPQQDGDQFKSSQTEEDGGGRVESVGSSEVTTPGNTADTEAMTTRSRGQRYNDADGGKSPAKRRKRHI